MDFTYYNIHYINIFSIILEPAREFGTNMIFIEIKQAYIGIWDLQPQETLIVNSMYNRNLARRHTHNFVF